MTVTKNSRAIEVINEVLEKMLATELVSSNRHGVRYYRIEEDYLSDPMRLEILHILNCKFSGAELAETEAI